jgi:hypothetical protein
MHAQNRPIPAIPQAALIALITPLARHFLASRATSSLRLIASCTPQSRSSARQAATIWPVAANAARAPPKKTPLAEAGSLVLFKNKYAGVLCHE